jgi:hypothetical protein
MLRITLRELLVLTAFVAAGLAALKYAGDVTLMIMTSGVHLCLMAMTVIALVDRGRRQAIASGFTACVAIYLALLMFREPNALYWWMTDKLLGRLHEAMVTETWVDLLTGQEVAFDPQWRVVGLPGNIGGKQSPRDIHFKGVGHYLWALLFGYLGSRLAAWIYARRVKAEETARAAAGRQES